MPRRSLKPYEIRFVSSSDNRLGIFPSRLQGTAISFTNQQELENKLAHFLNTVKKRASWFKNDSKLYIYKNTYYTFKVNNKIFKILDNKTNQKPLPDYVGQSLSKVINQNAFITGVEFENTLLTKKEREEIAQIGLSRQKEKARRESRINYFFLLGALNGLLGTIGLGLSLPLVAVKVAVKSLVSAFLGYVRQKYLDFSASFYAKGKKIRNQSERLAFEYGVKSESMWEWLKSFFRLSTYLHPFAFAAGLEYAFEKNTDAIAKALNKPLSCEKRFVLRAQIKRKQHISSRIPQNVHSTWIHFNNSQDLQVQLQNLVDEYEGDFTFTTSPAKLSISKEDNMQLPSSVSRTVQEIILNNACIQEVSVKPNGDKDMFPSNINNELKINTRHNAKEAIRRAKLSSERLSYSVIFGVFFNAILPLALISGVWGYLKQTFLDKVVKPYNTQNKIAKVKNRAEQQALLYGVKAGKSYKELCYSWGRKEAYTNFSAFEAGKEIAMEDNTPLLKEINRFKVK